MFSGLDHLIVAVNDLKEAEANYTKVFGIDSVWKGEHKALGTSNVIFNLKIHILNFWPPKEKALALN